MFQKWLDIFFVNVNKTFNEKCMDFDYINHILASSVNWNKIFNIGINFNRCSRIKYTTRTTKTWVWGFHFHLSVIVCSSWYSFFVVQMICPPAPIFRIIISNWIDLVASADHPTRPIETVTGNEVSLWNLIWDIIVL